MKLLLLRTRDDVDYLERFQRLDALFGVKLVTTDQVFINPVTLDAVCDKHGVDGVLCAQEPTLSAILHDMPDFIPPVGKKKLTLHDYAGSMLHLRSGRKVVVLEPLARLRTVAEEKFVVDRFVSKLTKPHKWYNQTKFQWSLITLDNRDQVMADIKSARLCAIDIEVQWPPPELRPIDCTSYTVYDPTLHETRSYVIDFDEPWHQQFIAEANACDTPKVLQRGLFDSMYFLRWGAPVNHWYHDTYHLFHSWLAELPKRLDFIAAFALRDVRYWKDDGKTGNRIDRHRYNALDGWATINVLLSVLSEIPEWAFKNYTELEFKMVFPALNASAEGLDCDEERFAQIAAKKEAEVEAQLEELQYLLASPSYNPGSPQQNSRLFQLLGCGDLTKSETLSDRENARRGTGKIQMMKAAARHPLNAMLLEKVGNYKREAKQAGTYFDATKLWDNRIHYELDPGGTETLRAASRESAYECGWQIQNIPSADDSFKQCVVAPPGWFIGEADKAQSEARCVGYMAGEEALIALVESENDYHSWNASAFFGVPYNQIYDNANHKQLNKPLRNLSKRTNHGANYNMGESVMLDTMGPKYVAETKVLLKLPSAMRLVQVCKYLLDQYNKTYPGVKGRWYASIITKIKLTGMLVSPFGWTRKFFGDPGSNKQDLNSAVAHGPQNLSVTIVNREWYNIWRATVHGDLRGRVRCKAQIHDSILFIYRTEQDAEEVHRRMDTRIAVTGADGNTREMFIPSDLSAGGKRRWSDIK